MKVTTKGQITIPNRIRKKYGIRPGTEVEIADSNGTIVIKKSGAGDAVDKVYGILGGKTPWRGTDVLIERLRGRL